MNRDFLKEAIADAKAVKESAIANAKVALEEAFSPQVKAMFASKLEEMEKEEMEEGYKDAEKMEEEMSDPVMRKDLEGDDAAEKETELMREEEDMELEEILAELDELDLNEAEDKMDEAEDKMDEAKDEMDEAEDKMDEAEDKMNEAEEEEEEETEEMDVEEDEEIDLEDMTEEELKKFIEDVIEDMVEAGELEAGESFEDDVEIDVDEEGEIEVEDDEETAVDEAYDNMDEMKDDEMMEMKKDLEEALETISVLRSELNEINILNAKLLYTNKVFRGNNLTEAQKVKVLKAFDKAETIKEVKLVFETLDTSAKKSSTKNSKTIAEARAKGSASNLTATPKATNKQPIVESDAMVLRFKKLAGII